MLRVDFKAPWSRTLRMTTAFIVALLCLLIVIGWFGGPRIVLAGRIALMASPPLILLFALITMVRGYVLTEDEIQVRRLGWVTRLPLTSLKAVEGKADAMRGSIRLAGNGGLFSFTGYFWNRQLKKYRAYATDLSRAVVLCYPDRTIVITPHDPQHFIMRVRTLLRTAGFPR